MNALRAIRSLQTKNLEKQPVSTTTRASHLYLESERSVHLAEKDELLKKPPQAVPHRITSIANR